MKGNDACIRVATREQDEDNSNCAMEIFSFDRYKLEYDVFI